MYFLAGDCRGAVVLLGLAGITDAADGYLARHYGWTSRAGAYLDPVADKLLLVTVFVSLGLTAVVPGWLAVLVVARDGVILAMVAAGLLFTKHRKFPPTIWGKISTTVQIVTALVAVAGCATGFGVPEVFIWATALTTAWSGAHYVWRGIQMLRQ